MNLYSKIMFLWKDIKLPVTPPTHLLEDHILNQMSSIEGVVIVNSNWKNYY